jgi:hypothetical protein
MEWLTFDEWYGSKPQFLRALDARDQKFVGETPKNFRAWTEPPRVTNRPQRHRNGRSRATPRVTADSRPTMTLEEMMRFHRPLRDQAWTRYRIKDGEKGPMVWEIKHVMIHPKNEDGLPTKPYHLIVARNVLNPDEIKYFVSNAPQGASMQTMLLVAFSRWRVERCFEDEKGELGLDHYEGRKYLGLKRHMILTTVSHLFLAKSHQELRGEKPGVEGVDRVPTSNRHGDPGEEFVAFGSSWCTVA